MWKGFGGILFIAISQEEQMSFIDDMHSQIILSEAHKV